MTETKDLSIRYETNPFIDDGFVIRTAKKQVEIYKGFANKSVLVNQHTGEISGTHVITHRKVDKEEFVKIFSKNIALTFELNRSGIKAFNVLIWAIQRKALEKDVVILDMHTLSGFINENKVGEFSLPTFRRGLSELESANIIAKTKRLGCYYINPSFVFNGNRIAFTNSIELDDKK